jgi:hypothetical protein
MDLWPWLLFDIRLGGLSRRSTEEQRSPSIPLDRIHVTGVDNFWQTVSATVKAGVPLASGKGAANSTQDYNETDIRGRRLARSLEGCVILLPRPLPQVGP